ncbi:hypothetical protein Sjap_008499 [Stephania japonica]|uniref:Fatty acid desaturase domain-containing protein n=1 Tax=Stephania japonica TaxID=461633 RepID=A0AAP0PEN8_9MAGN
MASAGIFPKVSPTPSMLNSSNWHHDDHDDGNANNIVMSDVVVKRKNRAYWLRKWGPSDLIISIGLMVHVHVMCLLYAWSTFSWSRFWMTICLGNAITLFGISVSYHRNLAHRAFHLPKWLEYLFAYCGVLAIQGEPMFWVSIHRQHHQFVDTEQDPHSPIEGFWFSHMTWLFDISYVKHKRQDLRINVRDLEKQFFYRFLRRTYFIHLFLHGVVLFWWRGFPMLVWGLYVRTVLTYHGTFLVNSACHIWGYQTWDTQDLSKNNWLVALIAFGEGWHNNHHAFEFSARHGHEWWQFDLGWYVIKVLELVGLATHVKVPSEAQKIRRMALKNEAKCP